MSTSEKKEGLVLVRKLKAPKELVFEAFSKAEALNQWWGPVGMPANVKHMDFREGGKMHYQLEGNGQIMWGLFTYLKIAAPDSMEFISAFSDENGNICKSPFPMDFPMKIYNRLTLVENNGITTLTLSGYPVEATPEQEKTYYGMIENMNQGWAGTFMQLENYLEKIQTH